MKKITLILICSILLVSCGIEKRVHRSGFHMNKKTITHSAEKKTSEKRSPSPLTDIENVDVAENNTEFVIPLKINKSNSILSSNYDQVSLVKPQNSSNHLNSNVSTILNETCDLIILKDGSEIKSKVLEINDDNIKYKLCDNLDGPTFTKSKDLIFMIKYPNGTSTVVNSMETKSTTIKSDAELESSKKEIEPLAIVGFSMNLLGFLIMIIELAGFFFPIWSLLFTITGSIFIVISSRKFTKNPNKYKGKGFLIAGNILGLITVIITTVYILAFF
jgi:hypothetical protein